MSFTSLVAPKGTAGSVANWVSYTKLDIETIVDEAQALIFSMLRVREMQTELPFHVDVNGSQFALPSSFLDPIGDLLSTNTGQKFSHLIESQVMRRRAYEQRSGALGTDALGTVANSGVINVHLPAHDLTIGSDFTIAGATDVGGLAMNNTYKVVVITDADNIRLFAANLDLATSGAVGGGGAAMTYIANKLIAGSPSAWAIIGSLLIFDGAFDTATQFRLPYYALPRRLSSITPTNFLTNRYPVLMRKACQASAADFMKDDVEYEKCVKGLAALIQSIAAESDLSYRGAEFGTDTP